MTKSKDDYLVRFDGSSEQIDWKNDIAFQQEMVAHIHHVYGWQTIYNRIA